MALDLCLNLISKLYLEHLFTNFLQILYRRSLSGRSGFGLKMDNFRQISTELWPLIYVIKISRAFVVN